MQYGPKMENFPNIVFSHETYDREATIIGQPKNVTSQNIDHENVTRNFPEEGNKPRGITYFSSMCVEMSSQL